jgi:hypothetical protein
MTARWCYALAIIIALSTLSVAEGQPVTEQPAWLKETLEVWAEQDASAAFARLEAGDAAAVVAKRYGELAQHLYNDRKDVAGMILAARAGVHFAFDRARQVAATDEPTATQLRGQAKAIAYNLGANCWPGWKDEGIVITASERAIGLDAARLNLRLAVELKRPAEPLGHAHWLLGAQLLAARQFDRAAAEFVAAANQFSAASKPTEQQMARTYEALTRRLQQPENQSRQNALRDSLTALQTLATDDAKFFADQIRTAEQALGQ